MATGAHELEILLKEQPGNYYLIGNLALTNMGLGDEAAASALAEQAMAVIPIEKKRVVWCAPDRNPCSGDGAHGRARSRHRCLTDTFYSRTEGVLASGAPLTPALLRLDPMFDPLRNDPRFQKLVASSTPATR